MGLVEKKESIISSTDSVSNYLVKEHRRVLLDYFNIIYKKDRKPNYSDFIVTMGLTGGTTVDGYMFDSSTIDRARLTSYLRLQYLGYLYIISIKEGE